MSIARLILIAIVRLQYVEKQIMSDDPSLSGATTAVLTQIEVFYSLVAVTIPCLRAFPAAFVTNYGAMGVETIMNGSYVAGSSQTKDAKASDTTNFALQSLQSAKRAIGRHEKQTEAHTDHDPPSVSVERLRPDPVGNHISTGHGKSSRSGDDVGSVGSDESTRGMIIKKEVAWQVDSESYRARSVSAASPERTVSER